MSRLNKCKIRQIKKKRLYLISSLTVMLLLILSVIAFPKLSTCITISKKNEVDATTTNSVNEVDYVVSESTEKTKEKINLDGYLFLGDSYTVLLEDTIKKYNPNAIVRAVEGVQPDYWIDHFKELPKNKNVNGVVLLIGVNGAAYSNNIPNKEELISSLVKKYKNKTIYVQEVFPVGKNFSKTNAKAFNDAIENNNIVTKKYCDHYDNVFYIDATSNLITNDGYLKFTSDGLHISNNKQETFYKNIEVAVNKSN